MKKNNVFMMAYIVFMIIIVIVRLFTDYSAWAFIVPAVTICSSIFAWADLLYTFGQANTNACDTVKSKALNIKKEIEEQIGIIDSVKKAVLSNEDNDSDQRFDEIEESYDSLILEIEKKEMSAIRGRAISKKIIGLSTTLYFSGFLAFMCIITFESVRIAVAGYQDILSVLAFAIILFSQYTSERLDNNLQKLITTCDNLETTVKMDNEELLQLANLIIEEVYL